MSPTPAQFIALVNWSPSSFKRVNSFYCLTSYLFSKIIILLTKVSFSTVQFSAVQDLLTCRYFYLSYKRIWGNHCDFFTSPIHPNKQKIVHYPLPHYYALFGYKRMKKLLEVSVIFYSALRRRKKFFWQTKEGRNSLLQSTLCLVKFGQRVPTLSGKK